jgi:uncharacterized protein (TIGR02453 family)
MAHFGQEYLDFFIELAGNNNKAWFDDNRSRYEKFVKEPFKLFIGDLIKEVNKVDPQVKVEPKDCITRINRDIRFSKDKTPYKLHMSAIISVGGKKDKSHPGMYIQADPEFMRIYGGAYELSTVQTAALRNAIAKDLKGFQKLIHAKPFVEAYGDIHGEKAKRIPLELRKAAEIEPLIFNKNMYYFAKLDPKTILSDSLVMDVMHYYKAGFPVQQFLEKTLFS